MVTTIKNKLRHVLTGKMYKGLIRTFGPIRYFVSMIVIRTVYMWSHSFGQIKYLSEEEYRIWRQSMLSMIKEYYQSVLLIRSIPVAYTFAMAKIDIIRKTPDYDRANPIVTLCVKNDLRKIRILVSHYRMLGIKKFAFLDNGSEDGTFEWLLEQRDIDLYRCLDKYQSFVKEGWINRVASYYGFDRWLILTDSDELIVYEGMEKKSLKDVTAYGQRNGIKRFKALMMDTYPEGKMFGKTVDIKNDYCWVDSDSYFERTVRAGKKAITIFCGGPRYRLMKNNTFMSKYPLVFFEKGTISDHAHYQYPHEEIDKAPCHLGILHYKFLDSDLAEYEKRAEKSSGFYNKGEYYKQYLDYYKSCEDACFMYEGSIKYKDSSSLEKIDFIKSIRFE